MAVRKIVKIDEDKCNGCGECIPSCAEGALAIVDGKARIVKDMYCDGLGACLGECPMDAISIEERDAVAFDEEKAMEHVAEQKPEAPKAPAGGCPGSMARSLNSSACACPSSAPSTPGGETPSALGNWPVQLHLVPPTAPYFKGADLLVAADCVPFALADFHSSFLQGRPVVIGCPKLDNGEFYINKLRQIFEANDLKSITILHMEVPCCFGLMQIVKTALIASGKEIPTEVVNISIDGKIKERGSIQ